MATGLLLLLVSTLVKRDELLQRHRSREVEPLRRLDVRRTEREELVLSLDSFGDHLGAADSPCRPVERGEKAVTGRVSLLPSETRELAAHERVVLPEELTPLLVAQLGRPARGASGATRSAASAA